MFHLTSICDISGTRLKSKLNPERFILADLSGAVLEVYGETKVEVEDTKNPQQTQKVECAACMKTFTTATSLKRHEERNPLCLKWKEQLTILENSDKPLIPISKISIQNHVKFVDFIEKAKNSSLYLNNLTCKHCKNKYSNTGNFNKHYETSIMCNKYAIIDYVEYINKEFSSL